ncbi:hypothetical protein CLV78_105149 [Aliiruegeria haliotis]|uniref:Uncharacterized protein n=1 Tax=Aliiruegeria haliotis TaxID=1280846 RepID=A0A2T0RPP4_9RHOB|nr:hypothetical protein CLV78_105149 [Aliiruegeria haliotis]
MKPRIRPRFPRIPDAKPVRKYRFTDWAMI